MTTQELPDTRATARGRDRAAGFSSPNAVVQRAATWAGPLMTLVFFVGFVPLAHFLPPPPPGDSAVRIQAFYRAHTDGIRIGFFLVLMVAGMFLLMGAAIASQTRRIEARWAPTMTYLQLATMAVCAVIAVFCSIFWEAAAFRPTTTVATTTQTLNDLGWFTFLWPWVPFSLWCVAIAVPIFQDHATDPIYPRWVGYLNVWTALLFIPAGLIVFTKQGIVAWNGVLAFYVPLFVFFIWVMLMSYATLRAITTQTGSTRAPATA